MPLYEYRCDGCGRRFEILQRMGEGSEGLVCPKCGGERLEKCFSTFAASTGGGASFDSGGCERAAAGDCGGGGGGFG